MTRTNVTFWVVRVIIRVEKSAVNNQSKKQSSMESLVLMDGCVGIGEDGDERKNEK